MADIDPAATVDGGDVLVMGGEILIGLSARTNEAGVAVVRSTFASYGPTAVVRLPSQPPCLHLKSFMSVLDERTIVLHDVLGKSVEQQLQQNARPYELIYVPDVVAANVLRVQNCIFIQDGFPVSEALLRQQAAKRELSVVALNMSELIKADGALTCCSVLIL
jgi:dimethylargininase